MTNATETAISSNKSTGKPYVLVISVPNRPQNVDRMARLGGSLSTMGYRYEVVPGPNMDQYCPANIADYSQSKAAGMKLLRNEWHGRIPDLATYDLALFQMATLCGHLRAWQHIVDSNTPAVILEDDAEVESAERLQGTVTNAQANGANVVLLDHRHCATGRPPTLPREASGLAGYWVDVKAATLLLAHFPLSIPVDWGVNKVFNEDVNAVCPSDFPVHEYGGEYHARTNSAAHGCKPGHVGFLEEIAHPVAMFLSSLVPFQRL